MSACCSVRLYSPLKMVFGKTGDTYQVYCNTYKTYAMATCYRGSGNPLERNINVTRETQTTTDTYVEDTQDFHPVETDHF